MIDTIAPPAIERPPQTTPAVIRLDDHSPLPKLSNTRDYIVILPPTVRRTNITINGGRNIIVVGGRVSIDKGLDQACWALKDGAPGRIIHLEGILNDARRGGQSDGFQIACRQSTVQILNSRTTGLIGGFERERGFRHADVWQLLAGARTRLENFTGSSHYNNLYMRRENDPLGSALGLVELNRVNVFGYKTNPLNTSTQQTLRAISLGLQPVPPSDPTSGDNAKLDGCAVWLHQVYGDAESAGRQFGDFAWPHAGQRMVDVARAEVATDPETGEQVLDWPGWRTDTPPIAPNGHVYGVVRAGRPPAGDWQPASTCGLNYPERFR